MPLPQTHPELCEGDKVSGLEPIRLIRRFPHVSPHSGFQILIRRQQSKILFPRLFRDGQGDRYRDGADLPNRRQQPAFLIRRSGRKLRQRFSRNHEHGIRDPAGLRGDDPERDSGKDV